MTPEELELAKAKVDAMSMEEVQAERDRLVKKMGLSQQDLVDMKILLRTYEAASHTDKWITHSAVKNEELIRSFAEFYFTENLKTMEEIFDVDPLMAFTFIFGVGMDFGMHFIEQKRS
jgi:hypothetical protein